MIGARVCAEAATELTCNLSISARCTEADASAVKIVKESVKHDLSRWLIFEHLTLCPIAASIGSQRIDIFL